MRGEVQLIYDCLIVEDEVLLAENTCKYLNLSGIQATVAFSMNECIQFINENTVRLILLDINLGDGCGYNLCQQLRTEYQMPIIFISSQTSEESILLALSVGGDDYICKPFSLSILLAKVKAVLKRLQTLEVQTEKVVFGEFEISLVDGCIKKNGNVLQLKRMEQKLLLYLVQNKNRVVEKAELFQQVWKENYVGDGTLNVHIRKLREKVEEDPSDPNYIITEYGRGYFFSLPNGGGK